MKELVEGLSRVTFHGEPGQDVSEIAVDCLGRKKRKFAPRRPSQKIVDANRLASPAGSEKFHVSHQPRAM